MTLISTYEKIKLVLIIKAAAIYHISYDPSFFIFAVDHIIYPCYNHSAVGTKYGRFGAISSSYDKTKCKPWCRHGSRWYSHIPFM